MSIPPLVPETGAANPEFVRRVTSLLNLVVKRMLGIGDIAERPNNPSVGTQFYDTSLQRPVWWDGAGWRDAGGSVA
jgi:hypothetical protein